MLECPGEDMCAHLPALARPAGRSLPGIRGGGDALRARGGAARGPAVRACGGETALPWRSCPRLSGRARGRPGSHTRRLAAPEHLRQLRRLLDRRRHGARIAPGAAGLLSVRMLSSCRAGPHRRRRPRPSRTPAPQRPRLIRPAVRARSRRPSRCQPEVKQTRFACCICYCRLRWHWRRPLPALLRRKPTRPAPPCPKRAIARPIPNVRPTSRPPRPTATGSRPTAVCLHQAAGRR